MPFCLELRPPCCCNLSLSVASKVSNSNSSDVHPYSNMSSNVSKSSFWIYSINSWLKSHAFLEEVKWRLALRIFCHRVCPCLEQYVNSFLVDNLSFASNMQWCPF